MTPEARDEEFEFASGRLVRGEINHDRLPPGKLRIELRASRNGAVVQSWPGIRIREGETTELGALTLGSTPRMLQVRVTDPPETKLSVRYGRAGERPLRKQARFQHGMTQLVSAPGGIDALILGPGIEPRWIKALTDDIEVELERLPPINLKLQHIDELWESVAGEEPLHALSLRFEPEDSPIADLLSPRDWELLHVERIFEFDDSPARSFAQWVIAPGAYALRVAFIHDGQYGFGEWTFRSEVHPSFELRSIDVASGTVSPTLSVDLRKLLEPLPLVRPE